MGESSWGSCGDPSGGGLMIIPPSATGAVADGTAWSSEIRTAPGSYTGGRPLLCPRPPQLESPHKPPRAIDDGVNSPCWVTLLGVGSTDGKLHPSGLLTRRVPTG